MLLTTLIKLINLRSFSPSNKAPSAIYKIAQFLKSQILNFENLAMQSFEKVLPNFVN